MEDKVTIIQTSNTSEGTTIKLAPDVAYKDFNTISEDTAQGLLDAFKKMNDTLNGFEDTWQRSYGVLVDEIKLKSAEKLIFYIDKYAQATFLTRWYWKRKMEKFVKGIDVLKEL